MIWLCKFVLGYKFSSIVIDIVVILSLAVKRVYQIWVLQQNDMDYFKKQNNVIDLNCLFPNKFVKIVSVVGSGSSSAIDDSSFINVSLIKRIK